MNFFKEILSVLLGVFLSTFLDLPAGPILVVSYVSITILIVLIKRINNTII